MRLCRRLARRDRDITGRLGRAEYSREQTAGHGYRSDVPTDVGRAARRIALGRRRFAARRPQAAQLVQDHVEPEPRDELHDVVVHALLLADTEDWHDVGVMEACRRARLALEAAQLPHVEQGM